MTFLALLAVVVFALLLVGSALLLGRLFSRTFGAVEAPSAPAAPAEPLGASAPPPSPVTGFLAASRRFDAK
jgi:hypothetical protein